MHSKEKEVPISDVLENVAIKKEICTSIQNRKLDIISKNQNVYQCKEMKGKRREFVLTEKSYTNSEKTPKTR